MRPSTGVILSLTLIVLSQTASDYPKVVRKDGQVCVQNLTPKGTVEETCRADGGRQPLPAGNSSAFEERPVPSLQPARTAPTAPPTPGALYWAQAKMNWSLAFKIGAVGGFSATLISTVAALVAAGSGLPRAADPYLAGAAVSGAGALLFTVIAVVMDRWGSQEIEPLADSP